MDWLNIHISKQIRSPAAIGSAPSELGTWVRVIAYCCEQENGGRIVGGASWKDRQWQQTCAVTLRELRAADRLIQFDGSDVVVNGYPIEKEAEVQRARRRASAGAMARWGHREGISSSNAQACSGADAEREVGKGNGMGMVTAAAAPPPCAQAAVAADPLSFMDGMQEAPPGEPAHVTKTCDRRTFGQWRADIARRIFWTREEDELWKAIFAAEGWDEMTKGYEFLAKKHPAPKKIFISMFQEIRE